MGDGVHNVGHGRNCELHDRIVNNDPANSGLVVVLLQNGETDAALKDHATLADLLAAAGNTEADFDNYARKVLTDADLSASTVDNANDRRSVDMPDQVWSAAGGTNDNTLARGIICYDPDVTGGDDTTIEPMVFKDFVVTTNGGDITMQIHADGYYYGN